LVRKEAARGVAAGAIGPEIERLLGWVDAVARRAVQAEVDVDAAGGGPADQLVDLLERRLAVGTGSVGPGAVVGGQADEVEAPFGDEVQVRLDVGKVVLPVGGVELLQQVESAPSGEPRVE
jgi:hypothetical protein